MNQGYIKLFRILKNSSLWMLDPITFKVAIYLLLEANYKPRQEFISTVGREVLIGRGELITSYNSIAEGCRYRDRHNKIKTLTYAQARTSVKKLKTIGFITEVTIERCLHLLIENYDFYQSWSGDAREVSTEVMTDLQQTYDNEQEGKKERKDIYSGSEVIKGAKTILAYLNETCGRSFRERPANLEPITNWLSKGYDEELLRKVIDHKRREWGEKEEMEKYLRPATLFGPKFPGYLEKALEAEARPEEKLEYMAYGAGRT